MGKASIGLLIALFFTVSKCRDRKETNKILEHFKDEYSSITEACKAVGFVKTTCTTREEKQRVVFTAVVTSANSTWNSGTLIFNVIISNVGNGYNPKTGVFTAPINGTYVFYVSALDYSNQYLGLEIVLNGVSKVRLIGEHATSYQTGTNMVVLSLKKGDSVWVTHHRGKGYYSASLPVTTFSGFMI